MERETEIESNVGLHDMIENYRDAYAPPARADRDHRRYAVGDHDEVATSAQRASLGDRANRVQRDNVIGQCLEQIAGRLLFRRYLVDGGETEAAWLETFGRKNQLARQVVSLVVRAMTDGSGALSVSWHRDEGRAIVHPESWWDGTYGMFVAHANDGSVAWACSDWFHVESGKERRTVYLPDRILRFQRGGESGWEQLDEIAWVQRDGRPLGVPVAHFPNGVSAFGPYPPSTVGAVIAMQDALNAAQFDIMAASALNGFPIYTSTGVVEAEDDEQEVGPGEKWSTPNAAARFGMLGAGSIEQLLKHKQDLRSSIAAHFPVPDYRIGSGDWPSGFALQRGDSTMIAKVKLLGDLFAPGLVLIAHRAMELATTFGGENLNEDNLIKCEWAPPDQVDPGTQRELDLAEVELYEALERLTPALRAKTGHLTTDELAAVERELAARQVIVGDIGEDDSEEEENPS